MKKLNSVGALSLLGILGCVSGGVSKEQSLTDLNANQHAAAGQTAEKSRPNLEEPVELLVPIHLYQVSAKPKVATLESDNGVLTGCGVTSLRGMFYLEGEWTLERLRLENTRISQLLKSSSSKKEFQLRMASMALLEGDYERSLSILNKTKHSSESIELQLAEHLKILALLGAKEADVSILLKRLQQLAANSPRSHIINLNSGVLLMSKGNARDALLFFRRAIGSKPSNPVAYFHAADAAYRLGMSLEAERYVSKAVAFSEDSRNTNLLAQALLNRAVVLKFKMSRDESAIEDLKSVLNLKESSEFLKSRARAYLEAIAKNGV